MNLVIDLLAYTSGYLVGSRKLPFSKVQNFFLPGENAVRKLLKVFEAFFQGNMLYFLSVVAEEYLYPRSR